MTDTPTPGPQDREPAEGSRETVDAALADQPESPEPTPVAPAPASQSPSSTGVVAGDPDEALEA